METKIDMSQAPEEMAVLENWKVATRPFAAFQCIVADIYNDVKGRFPDGDTVWTSALEAVDEEQGVAKTMNTWYKLGKKFEE